MNGEDEVGELRARLVVLEQENASLRIAVERWRDSERFLTSLIERMRERFAGQGVARLTSG